MKKFCLLIVCLFATGCRPTGGLSDIQVNALAYENQYRRDFAKQMRCSKEEIQEQVEPLTFDLVNTRRPTYNYVTAEAAKSFRDDLYLLPCVKKNYKRDTPQ